MARRTGFLQSIWQAATLRERLLLVASLAYIVSPVDILPETVLGPLGLTDDLAALAILLGIVRQILRRPR